MGETSRFSAILLAVVLTACAATGPGEVEAPASAGPSNGVVRRIDFAGQRYERVDVVDDVVIYEHPSSSMVRVGAEGRFPAPPAEVRRVLLDYPRHAAVLERVSECRVIAEGPRWLRLYQRLSLPVIDDRDFTLRVKWGERDGTHWIRYRAVREGPPEVDGVVRVTRNHGGWDLVPIDGGEATLARYQSNLDLAGMVPAWASRSGALGELATMFQSMCGLLPPQYRGRCR